MMANYVCSEDEVSNMERNEKQIDDFHSYVARPTQGNPFCEHWSRTLHLVYDLDIEYLEQARAVLAVLDQ